MPMIREVVERTRTVMKMGSSRFTMRRNGSVASTPESLASVAEDVGCGPNSGLTRALAATLSHFVATNLMRIVCMVVVRKRPSDHGGRRRRMRHLEDDEDAFRHFPIRRDHSRLGLSQSPPQSRGSGHYSRYFEEFPESPSRDSLRRDSRPRWFREPSRLLLQDGTSGKFWRRQSSRQLLESPSPLQHSTSRILRGYKSMSFRRSSTLSEEYGSRENTPQYRVHDRVAS